MNPMPTTVLVKSNMDVLRPCSFIGFFMCRKVINAAAQLIPSVFKIMCSFVRILLVKFAKCLNSKPFFFLWVWKEFYTSSCSIMNPMLISDLVKPCINVLRSYSFVGFFVENYLCWKFLALHHNLSLGYLKLYVILLDFTKPSHMKIPFWH